MSKREKIKLHCLDMYTERTNLKGKENKTIFVTKV